MDRKSAYRAMLLPAIFLCTQLTACSLSIGSASNPATQQPTSITGSWNPATNALGQQVIHTKHTHNLARLPEAATLTEKHCNTLQMQGSLSQTARADKHSKATPQMPQAPTFSPCHAVGWLKHRRTKRRTSILVSRPQIPLKQAKLQFLGGALHKPEILVRNPQPDQSSSITTQAASTPEP